MKKVLLCILDGFGYSKEKHGNATIYAEYINNLMNIYPTTFLDASGRAVGLPDGQFGNSEVGHLTIGSGRIIKQKLPLINDAILSGDLNSNDGINNFIKNIPTNTCHLMGLFSDGGVHSSIDHFFWAISKLRQLNINIKAHLFLDGRDVGYKDAANTLQKAIEQNKISIKEIATLQGRFFAMDRDNRDDRTEYAYNLIVNGISEKVTDNPINVIEEFYSEQIFDEMMPSIKISGYEEAGYGDGFWMLNFRADRIKQLLRKLQYNKHKTMIMASCDDDIDSNSTVVFPYKEIKNHLGEILASNNIRQLRIAETEKYAHVTYFFNGGNDGAYPLEDRILVPSPRVLDYSTTPAMSAFEIADGIKKSFENHDVIIANFANPDMLGHTGDFEVASNSIKILDKIMKDVVDAAFSAGYDIMITADHGNAEAMFLENGAPNKAHTCSKVPFIYIPTANGVSLEDAGELQDVAPSILHVLGIPLPLEMTGKSLLSYS